MLAQSPAISFSKILESRRTFLSGQLSEVCRETDRPRILSVANGALREAETAIDLCQAASGTFVVLDATGQPPDLFRFDHQTTCARYISYPHGAIPSKDNIGEFDYVYALNLLNELDQRRARAAIVNLLPLVRPGGRLLLSNFTPELTHLSISGFQRGEEELGALVPDSSEHQILGHAIWRDDSRAVLYLEVQKSGLVRRGRTPRLGFLH